MIKARPCCLSDNNRRLDQCNQPCMYRVCECALWHQCSDAAGRATPGLLFGVYYRGACRRLQISNRSTLRFSGCQRMREQPAQPCDGPKSDGTGCSAFVRVARVGGITEHFMSSNRGEMSLQHRGLGSVSRGSTAQPCRPCFALPCDCHDLMNILKADLQQPHLERYPWAAPAGCCLPPALTSVCLIAVPCSWMVAPRCSHWTALTLQQQHRSWGLGRVPAAAPARSKCQLGPRPPTFWAPRQQPIKWR